MRHVELSDRVTIKSIAKDLGISHMTVSRALSDHPNVQKDTRDAVRRRAAELGYVKSAAATAMRGDGTAIVGLLLPNIVNEFYARFANDLAEACEAFSYQLIIHLTNDDVDAEAKALKRLREVQAMAAIMVPAPGAGPSTPVHLSGMNIIQLIRHRPMTGTEHLVLVEDGDAIRDAVVNLFERGHTKIAYIGANSELSSGRGRLKAFRAGLAASNLNEEPGLIKTGNPSFQMGCEYAREILTAGKATAIVCGGFEISNGALNALLESQVAQSGKFGFIGYGDPSFYSWIDGGISTIQIPVLPLAQQALQLLRAGDINQDTPQTHGFEAMLVLRGT